MACTQQSDIDYSGRKRVNPNVKDACQRCDEVERAVLLSRSGRPVEAIMLDMYKHGLDPPHA
jgi:hypothetical protein